MFKEILKASRNNQASIFAFTFKFKKASKCLLFLVFITVYISFYYS